MYVAAPAQREPCKPAFVRVSRESKHRIKTLHRNIPQQKNGLYFSLTARGLKTPHALKSQQQKTGEGKWE
jgi:hypothetical protein